MNSGGDWGSARGFFHTAPGAALSPSLLRDTEADKGWDTEADEEMDIETDREIKGQI